LRTASFKEESMKALLSLFLVIAGFAAQAQFAPQAGIAGSTAISATAAEITAWANHCSVQRGYLDIATPSTGITTTGDSTAATGPANGTVVCLGDSGIATLTFVAALYDGPGADFAVFENGFKDPANGAMAFLELAFVEVSSDGTNFYRFHAVSNTPTNTQIPGSGVYMDASLLNNLAGKYIANYGTPFDLSELAGTPGLDVNNVTHVRLVDVVGSVGTHSCSDDEGKVINDPYPTNFPTGGFDLDAVAAIHMYNTGINTYAAPAFTFYPNPTKDLLHINTSLTAGTLQITSAVGMEIKTISLDTSEATISTTDFPSGLYYLTFTGINGSTQWAGSFVKL